MGCIDRLGDGSAPDSPRTAHARGYHNRYASNLPGLETDIQGQINVLSHASGKTSGMAAVQTDTSAKISRGGDGTVIASSRMQQNHLRSSLVTSQFYDRAEATVAWEVAEVNISQLPSNIDERDLKNICRGFDCQVVKVVLDLDPISNSCKGRGKLVLRYNPEKQNNLQPLVDAFTQKGYAVAFLE